MEPDVIQRIHEQLYKLLAETADSKAIEALLCDICTTKEVAYMAQRLECARLLMEGETYEKVIADTEISSATLSRVSRCVREGTGGYNRIFKDFLAQ